MSDRNIKTEQDVNKLVGEAAARKLAREAKAAKRIYRLAIANVIAIITVAVVIVSWPQLSAMISQDVAESVKQAGIVVGIIAVLSLLEENVRRIWQYRRTGNPRPFDNYFNI